MDVIYTLETQSKTLVLERINTYHNASGSSRILSNLVTTGMERTSKFALILNVFHMKRNDETEHHWLTYEDIWSMK